MIMAFRAKRWRIGVRVTPEWECEWPGSRLLDYSPPASEAEWRRLVENALDGRPFESRRFLKGCK
jgi:hypothetical protein